MQSGLEIWTTENQQRAIIQAQRTWRSTQLGCQEAGHSFSFFIRSRISGHAGISSGSTLPETTSRGFWHPTETTNGKWRGQPKLYQTLPKPSYAQEEQEHRDKVSLHLGQNGRWEYFNSLRSYRQNGSGHLHKVLTRSENGNIQSSFDGNRLYAISSSLSGGVRILVRVEDLNLVLLESLTYEINLTGVNWFKSPILI